jgi:hypothetical protein
MPPSDLPLPSAQLADMFGFTLDDLALNRAGQFSARQRQNLLYRSARIFVCGAALLLMSVIVIATLYQSVPQRSWFVLLALLAILQGVILIILAQLVLRPPVHTATGVIRRGTDMWKPAIIVEGKCVLRTTTRRWKRLPESLPGEYRIYYGPDARLLSMEPEGASV